MTEPNTTNSKERVIKILTDLSEQERKLLSYVLKIEQDNLHLERPRTKEDIIKAIREHIK